MSAQMTPVGVPSELVFNLPASMLDSRKIEQRINSVNQASFSSAGQVAKFTIPQTDRTLINGQTMYLTGNLDIFGLTGTSGTDTYAILGTFYSLFSRQTVNANGQVWETIERPGELVNMLLNMTMNSAEKVSQGLSFGTAPQLSVNNNATDGTGNISFSISDGFGPNNNKTLCFAIPIIGALDSAKFIPMWNSNIDLELTVRALSEWLTTVNGAGSIATATFSLYNLELVFDSIELSPESFNMVMANYPQKIVIKTQSYNAGTAQLASGISGGQDLPINNRLSSMKQLFYYFNQSSCADQTFGGVNPNGTDVVFISNGKYYPQRPIKLTNPAEVYMQIQKSFGSIKTYSHSGSIGINELRRRQTANNWYLAPNTTKATLDNYGNKFYLAIDTEIINTNKDSLYNGIQTGVNSNLRLNIADTLTSAMTCYYWACYDVLIEFDFTLGVSRAIY